MRGKTGALLVFRCFRSGLGGADFAGADSALKLLPIVRGLVRVSNTEGGHRLIEPVIVAKITCDSAGIARAGVAFGKQFAAHFRVLQQPLASEVLFHDARLMVA